MKKIGEGLRRPEFRVGQRVVLIPSSFRDKGGYLKEGVISTLPVPRLTHIGVLVDDPYFGLIPREEGWKAEDTVPWRDWVKREWDSVIDRAQYYEHLLLVTDENGNHPTPPKPVNKERGHDF